MESFLPGEEILSRCQALQYQVICASEEFWYRLALHRFHVHFLPPIYPNWQTYYFQLEQNSDPFWDFLVQKNFQRNRLPQTYPTWRSFYQALRSFSQSDHGLTVVFNLTHSYKANYSSDNTARYIRSTYQNWSEELNKILQNSAYYVPEARKANYKVERVNGESVVTLNIPILCREFLTLPEYQVFLDNLLSLNLEQFFKNRAQFTKITRIKRWLPSP